MKTTIQHIAQNISLNPQAPILIHFWGKGQEDQALLHIFKTAIEARLAADHQNGVSTPSNPEAPITPAVHAVFFDQEALVESFNAGQFRATSKAVYGTFEVATARTTIDLCRFSPPSLMGDISEEAKPQFIQFMRGLFGAATQEGNLFAQLRLPSDELAMECGMTLDHYSEKWTQLVDIDYHELRDRCEKAHQEVKPFEHFTLTTESKSNPDSRAELTFSVAGRPWHQDSGNGDFPAGEIYIAPLEGTVNGSFIADCVFWEGTTYENVQLTFKEGNLVESIPNCILEDLKHAPGDALKFAEFGLGQNPSTSTLTGNSLFDEKILGTCHIAIGTNEMFGGTNQGPVHIDFIASQFNIKCN